MHAENKKLGGVSQQLLIAKGKDYLNTHWWQKLTEKQLIKIMT